MAAGDRDPDSDSGASDGRRNLEPGPSGKSEFAPRVSATIAELVERIRESWQTWLPVIVIAVSAFTMRFSLEVAHPGPSGADYGNYLANAAILVGRNVTGAPPDYPPLYPLFLSALLILFPPLTALQISGALLPAVLTFPAYKLTRLYGNRPFGLVATAIIVMGDPISELIGWGGNPQVLAMIFIALFFYLGILALETRRRRTIILAGFALSLVAGSHQLSLLYLLLLLGLVALGIAVVRRRAAVADFRTSFEIVGWGILLSLPYLPAYLEMAGRLQPFAPPNLITPELSSFVGNVSFVLLYAAIWYPLMVLALAGYSARLRPAPIRSVVGLVMLLGPFLLTLTVFAYHPARPIYFISMGVGPGIAAALTELHGHRGWLRVPRRAAAARLIAVLAVVAILVPVVYVSQERMSRASSYYYMLGNDVVSGMEWLRDRTPADARALTNGPAQYGIDELTGYEWAWWIEGFASRTAYGTASLPLLSYRDDVPKSDLANIVFTGRHVGTNQYWRIGENAPLSPAGTPLLQAYFDAGYKGAASFDDSAILLNEGGVAESPFGWPGRAYSQSITSAELQMGMVYTRAGLTFNRTTRLEAGTSNATVDISIFGNVSEITVPVFATSNARFVALDVARGTAIVSATGDFGDENPIDIRVATANSTLETAAPPSGDLSGSRVDFRFAMHSMVARLRFIFNTAHPPESGTVGFRLIDSTALLNEAGIEYVFVSTTRARDLGRFLADTAFSVAYRNTGVIIFRLQAFQAFEGGLPPKRPGRAGVFLATRVFPTGKVLVSESPIAAHYSNFPAERIVGAAFLPSDPANASAVLVQEAAHVVMVTIAYYRLRTLFPVQANGTSGNHLVLLCDATGPEYDLGAPRVLVFEVVP